MYMSSSFRRLLCLSALFVSAAAGAQTLALSFASGEESAVVGRSGCSTQFVVHWAFSTGYQVCSDLRVWASTQSCSTEGPKSNDVELFQTPLSSASSGKTKPLSDWPGFKEAGKVPCGTEGEDGVQIKHNICGLVKLRNTYDNKCEESRLSNTLSVTYRTSRVPAPLIDNVIAYDGQVSIRFSVSGENLDKVELFGRRSDETGDGRKMGEQRDFSNNRPLSASGFKDGVPYRLYLEATDKAGNRSERSEEIEVSTVPTLGFWDIYKQNGGAGGGCHSAGGGGGGSGSGVALPFALAFLGLYTVRHPKRRPGRHLW